MTAEVTAPPTSSLGTMAARNGLLVRVKDNLGSYGWGEIWCNFPPLAHRHRQHILEDVIAPELIGRSFDKPGDIRRSLEQRWSSMALHVGEQGPFGHCIAGLDIALWDMEARRQSKPLAHILSDKPSKNVRVYASTLPPDGTDEIAKERLNQGYRAFKLKVGRDPARDINMVRNVRDAIGSEADIMVDANQIWTAEQAARAIEPLGEYGLSFVEEPIRADAPIEEWTWLQDKIQVPLAAGENICTDEDYKRHLNAGALTYYQPDVAKWGGISGCTEVGEQIREKGYVYCPHYMGTAVGLAASMHLLAAVGGNGFVELDSNENPLRTDLTDLELSVDNGHIGLPKGVGIGVEPDPDQLVRFAHN